MYFVFPRIRSGYGSFRWGDDVVRGGLGRSRNESGTTLHAEAVG